MYIQGAVWTGKEARLFEVLSVPVPKLRREEQIGDMCVELLYAFPPTYCSSTLIHYFLFVSFVFVCHALFFRKMLQLREVKACMSMKDTL